MKIRILIALLAAAFAAACARSGSGKLSVSAKNAGASASATGIDAGNGLTITRIRIAVCKVELEAEGEHGDDAAPGGTATTSAFDHEGKDGGDDGDEGEEGEVERGPFLVDLSGDALGGRLGEFGVADVPAGTFDEIELVICPPAPPAAGETGGLADLGAAHASIIVDGTTGGAVPGTFSFATALEVRIEREDVHLVVEAGKDANVTLTVTPDGWFKKADGTPLDPASDADRSAIEANIRASFAAFEDDDHDGEDDHGEDDRGDGH